MKNILCLHTLTYSKIVYRENNLGLTMRQRALGPTPHIVTLRRAVDASLPTLARCASRHRYKTYILSRVSTWVKLWGLSDQCRAHGVLELSRPARLAQAQRRASMLHHHTRARNTGVGVSRIAFNCSDWIINLIQCSLHCEHVLEIF